GRDQVVPVAAGPGEVTALTVDPAGQAVIALRQFEHGASLSCSLRRPDGSYRTGPEGHFPALEGSWLTPVLPWGPIWLVGLGDRSDLIIVDAASWMPWKRLAIPQRLLEPPAIALLLPSGPSSGALDDRLVVLTHEGHHWVLFDDDGRRLSGA